MSQYIYFYVKTNNDIYYPLGTFGRSHVIYEMFEDYAPYEKVAPLTKGFIKEAIDEMEIHITNLNNSINATNEAIDFLKTAAGDMDERIERLYELVNDKAETKEEIERQKSAIAFGRTLLYMISEAEDDNAYSSENYKYGIDPEKYIYVGIESGNPNVVYDDDGWNNIIENRAIGYKKEN